MSESNVSTLDNEWELIWTNDSPSSAFSAKTLSLDLSKYEWVYMEFKISTSSNIGRYYISHIDAGNTAYMRIVILNTPFTTSGSTATPYIYCRQATVTTTGIKFSTGYRKATNATTGAAASTNYVKPTRIWAK